MPFSPTGHMVSRRLAWRAWSAVRTWCLLLPTVVASRLWTKTKDTLYGNDSAFLLCPYLPPHPSSPPFHPLPSATSFSTSACPPRHWPDVGIMASSTLTSPTNPGSRCTADRVLFFSLATGMHACAAWHGHGRSPRYHFLVWRCWDVVGERIYTPAAASNCAPSLYFDAM